MLLTAVTFLFLSKILEFSLAQLGLQTDIKVGLLFSNTGDFELYYGYDRCVAGLNVALDRIASERLLPDYNFTFYVKEDNCKETLAAGRAAELIEYDNVDVILGPICSEPAIIVGSLSKFYNVPMINWGAASATSLSNTSYRFTTALNSIGPSMTVARGFIQLLIDLKYDRFGYLYSEGMTKRCSYLRDDVLYILAQPEIDITLAYYKEVNVSDPYMMNQTFEQLEKNARIVFLCSTSDTDKVSIVQGLGRYGLVTNRNFVFIFVEQRGTGFDMPTYDTNGTNSYIPLWQNPVVTNQTEIREYLNKFFFFDLSVPYTIRDSFEAAVKRRSSGWPFYCTTCGTVGTGASSLSDALYLYAIALNKTLSNPNIYPTATSSALGTVTTQRLRLGAQITEAANNVTFTGASGKFMLDENSIRINMFDLTGLSSNHTMITYYQVTGSAVNGSVTPTNSTAQIWTNWGNKQPPAVPVCGFDGSLCPDSILKTYGGYIYAAIAIIAISAIATATFLIRGQYLEYKRLNAAWQINFEDLYTPDEKNPDTKSLQPSVHSHSNQSVLKKPETECFAFFMHHTEAVAARKFKSKIIIQARNRAEFRMMRQIDNNNLAKFLGLCTDGSQYLSIWRFYHRGSIKDIIAAGSFAIDGVFMTSLIRDIINGLHFIHHSSLHCHGHLSSSNCLVDERWVVKISDYGILDLFQQEPIGNKKLLYLAPELLRKPLHPLKDGVHKAVDIYSFAMVATEIINRHPPWESNNQQVEDPDEIVYLLKRRRDVPIRPVIDVSAISDLSHNMPALIQDCWLDDPNNRPTTGQVQTVLKSMGNKNQSLMDHVFQVLQNYMNTLQEEVESRTKALMEEKKRSDVLLYRLLPRQIADKLKSGSVIEPESFDQVTVFFSDVVRFGELASKSTAIQAITLLNDLFTMFDGVIETYDCYKVESVGDDTLVVSGLPVRNGNKHVKEIANLSLAFMNGVAVFRIPHLPHEKVQLRIGFHSGPCVAGVVGLAMPRYCLFGDTINTSSRMCSNGRPDKIHLSASSNHLLQEIGGFSTISRGELIIKGKGVMETFFLEGMATDSLPFVSNSRETTASLKES
ncbi:unnamed protein product [Bursaphelenchus okinawaensis]|uniref:Guanylate cyclase n=1 Tax=Bursaphelenchus okinawaensis TaxID=465554 RepID=A0A811KV49_9BILA|nr:unnamed protein product [Bursaphelenchus okinawaensis]CAG9111553.1 unnamed protein product [Bursaphelenchus okinawaensis]